MLGFRASTLSTADKEEETTELVEEPTELVEDQGSGEKEEQEVTTTDTALNTSSVPISTASATPKVSTAAANFLYIRRSVEKRKDKGKEIMIKDESVQKKSKKQLEQERLSHEEAIKLQEQIDEEERKRIARDAEIAKQLQEEYDKARKKKAIVEVDTAHVIDWSDPFVIRYHALQNRPRSVAEVRKNMCIYLKNQGQDVEAKPAKRQRTEEVSESVQEQTKTDEEPKTDELILKTLNKLVIIVPDEGINVEALQTKYLIIGWEVYSKDTMQFWKIIRVGNHTEVYQVFEDMLKNFDRDDLVKLWSLVQEKYNSSGLTEDKEIELWVELKMLFEPDAENLLELQKYMHDPLKWDQQGVAQSFVLGNLDQEGDYEMWKLRIDQYFQVQDYAIWEVIEYGNSFKPVARTTTNADGTSTSTIPDLGTISFDDLYNNFKIVEQEVKRSVTSSSNSSSQNVAFVSTPDSTNEDNTANVQDSTASTHVSTASTNNSTASLSDATVYAFLANQPNGSQVVHEDLEQIHEDDLEEMDLKWQLALLSLKARKFYQRTGKKIIINGSDTAGYDKSKVECFNCHKMGHFARECRGPRNQESRPRNQESSKRTMNVEDTSSKAMVAFDGADSEVYNHKTCSDTCLKSYETLKSQYDSLRVEFNKSEFDLATYKRGLASVEEQLVFYKKNEVMLCDQIAVLKRDASFKDSEINALNIQIEKLKKEKESNQIKIDNFENASKNLDKLIGSQISDNNRKGVGYNVVPPPPTGLFAPPTIDLSSSGLKEFQQPEFEGYGVNVNKSVSENSSNEIKKTTGAPIIEDWVSDCDEDESEVMVSDNVQHKSEPKPEQAKQPRKINENPRNNRTNWNEKKTQKLGVGFQFTKKACFVCGSFNHLIKDCDFHDKKMVQKPVINNVQKGTGQREVRPVWNNALRTNHQNFSNSRRNFAPTAVLTKSGIVPISTARQRSSKAATPLSAARPINTAAPKLFVNAAKTKPNVFQKAHSLSRRPFNQQTALNNRSLNNKINTAKINSVNTAKGKRVTSVVGKQGINAVKSSACWVWRPKRNIVDHISKNSGSYICKPFDYGDPQVALKDTGIFDSGCSRHMTGNKSFLTDYQDYDGGFVAFAGSSKGGRITGKGKIKTGKLDFEDVYFVKELKFNLFSVSQMCDKKNSVLFTETECLILSPDFKLPDENQVMLKIPRKDNMYSFDLKNVVPSKGLTCLIAKATNDESNMWHRRLGHINFKTTNKLVKGNLVRGFPSKIFKNNHSCVACQKGKQHKASCKSKLVTSVSQPLQILHMDLFGPTFVKSIMGKAYCLVVTDDYSKFSWVFFLAKKDETSGILKNFITGIENQLNHKVKIIRCENETECKNYEMNQFCGIKGIKREFSNARTPQQNRVSERKNRTLIKAARTMLTDSLLPI
ncbi:putative ribonuclease H-like domain-containing protein [Tanacetum coccineum]